MSGGSAEMASATFAEEVDEVVEYVKLVNAAGRRQVAVEVSLARVMSAAVAISKSAPLG